jgi:hypothetical protein
VESVTLGRPGLPFKDKITFLAVFVPIFIKSNNIIVYNIEMVRNSISINCTLENGLTVRNIIEFFITNFFSIFVERYLVTLLISINYCEYVPSSVSRIFRF